MGAFSPPSLGWHQSLRDFRDASPEDPRFQEWLELLPGGTGAVPAEADLREYFPDVQDQGSMNTSSVHAALALVEYFERRGAGEIILPSRLFLYHNARSLMRIQGDVGSDLRSVFKALACFGVPPESYWPYADDKVDQEPAAFLFSYARKFDPLRYLRLDGRNSNGASTLQRVREFVACGFPVAFGFPVPSSISDDGDVPYRPKLDSIRGGQAVVAVGYDDRRAGSTRGALRIRNSWGSTWGDGGYGWLPYRYIEEQLASDFWTIVHPPWLESGEFARPVLSATADSH